MAHASESDHGSAIEAAAADWLARRERGLTAEEQDRCLQWLGAQPAHGRALARLERTWNALDALAEQHGLQRTPPDPDLLAPAPRRLRRYARVLAFSLAAAAAIAAGAFFLSRPQPSLPARGEVATAGLPVATQPQRVRLADGSVVELNAGARVEPAFTDTERRVRLSAGEAHFSVAKNPARPFIVDTGYLTVRAVGTAFDVAHRDALVEVLVTEGKVQVQRTDPGCPAAALVPVAVAAGERARIDDGALATLPVVTAVAAAEADRALAWRSVQLRFSDLPLRDVVAEFNRRNARQLVFGDSETAEVLVGGSFRADQLDAFVRLLEQSFGVTAERRDDGAIVLRQAK